MLDCQEFTDAMQCAGKTKMIFCIIRDVWRPIHSFQHLPTGLTLRLKARLGCVLVASRESTNVAAAVDERARQRANTIAIIERAVNLPSNVAHRLGKEVIQALAADGAERREVSTKPNEDET